MRKPFGVNAFNLMARVHAVIVECFMVMVPFLSWIRTVQRPAATVAPAGCAPAGCCDDSVGREPLLIPRIARQPGWSTRLWHEDATGLQPPRHLDGLPVRPLKAVASNDMIFMA